MRLSQPHHKSWERFFLVQVNFCQLGFVMRLSQPHHKSLASIFLVQATFCHLGFVMRLTQPHHKSLAAWGFLSPSFLMNLTQVHHKFFVGLRAIFRTNLDEVHSPKLGGLVELVPSSVRPNFCCINLAETHQRIFRIFVQNFIY